MHWDIYPGPNYRRHGGLVSTDSRVDQRQPRGRPMAEPADLLQTLVEPSSRRFRASRSASYQGSVLARSSCRRRQNEQSDTQLQALLAYSISSCTSVQCAKEADEGLGTYDLKKYLFPTDPWWSNFLFITDPQSTCSRGPGLENGHRDLERFQDELVGHGIDAS